ncbi:MAG: hypothetical protein J7M32_00710 [Deltaproteobacteria bacterium]|nr:hypothetical protein [Deltaproteobacteria bacterium]OQX63125.1 MAG: hypothetical protein B5M55_07420 [Desulfococcus sp. 4484_242]
MKRKKKRKAPSPALQKRLAELENMAAAQGIQIHYDVLEAAGLKLKGGMCTIRGECHLFIDRRKPMPDIIDFLKDQLARTLPRDLPEVGKETKNRAFYEPT